MNKRTNPETSTAKPDGRIIAYSDRSIISFDEPGAHLKLSNHKYTSGALLGFDGSLVVVQLTKTKDGENHTIIISGGEIYDMSTGLFHEIPDGLDDLTVGEEMPGSFGGPVRGFIIDYPKIITDGRFSIHEEESPTTKARVRLETARKTREQAREQIIEQLAALALRQ